MSLQVPLSSPEVIRRFLVPVQFNSFGPSFQVVRHGAFSHGDRLRSSCYRVYNQKQPDNYKFVTGIGHDAWCIGDFWASYKRVFQYAVGSLALSKKSRQPQCQLQPQRRHQLQMTPEIKKFLSPFYSDVLYKYKQN